MDTLLILVAALVIVVSMAYAVRCATATEPTCTSAVYGPDGTATVYDVDGNVIAVDMPHEGVDVLLHGPR
jgi:hypothetical protein